MHDEVHEVSHHVLCAPLFGSRFEQEGYRISNELCASSYDLTYFHTVMFVDVKSPDCCPVRSEQSGLCT
jgi:hypothetical protein